MLIKFEIQVDGSSGATAVQAQAPAAKELSAAFTKPGGGGPPGNDPRTPPGSGPPGNDPRTPPGSGPPPSGSGTVLVIGPIVICGSAAGPSGFGTGVGPGGGGPPGNDPRTD